MHPPLILVDVGATDRTEQQEVDYIRDYFVVVLLCFFIIIIRNNYGSGLF